MGHNISNTGSSAETKLSLEEHLERAVRSRTSGTRNPNTFSTSEELLYMKAAVRESQKSPSLRNFMIRLCEEFNTELVDIQFDLVVDAQLGFNPQVCITTREDVSASNRQDMEDLVGRILNMINLAACGYWVFIVAAAKV